MQHATAAAEPRGKCSVTNAQKLNFRLGSEYQLDARAAQPFSVSKCIRNEPKIRRALNFVSGSFGCPIPIPIPILILMLMLVLIPVLCSISTLSTLTRSADEQV